MPPPQTGGVMIVTHRTNSGVGVHHGQSEFGRMELRGEPARTSLLPFGIAHFGKSLFWHSSELVFAFFLTERAGVPMAWMGAVLAGGLVLSACIDLVLGWRLRGTSFTLRRACRLQFVGACASAAMVTPLFAADLLPPVWRLTWTVLLAIGFRLAYALYDIPQNATLSLATHDEDGRARLAALRLFFSGVASITVATTLAALISNAQSNRTGSFALAALVMSAIAVASAWGLTRVRGGQRDTEDVTAAPLGIGRLGFVPLLALMFVLSAATSAFSKLEPYYVTYRWMGQGGTILIAASLGFTMAQPLWLAAIRRAGGVSSLLAAIVLLGTAALGFTLSARAGYYAQAGFAFAFGAANGGINTALWSSFAEAACAQRRTAAAFAFAMLTASSKAGLAIAGVAIAAWLSAVDYRVNGSSLDSAMAGFPVAGVFFSFVILAISRARRRLHRSPS